MQYFKPIWPEPRGTAPYLRSYAVNLVLDARCSWISPERAAAPAVAEVVLLTSTLELTGRTYRLDRAAGTAFMPYAGWTILPLKLDANAVACLLGCPAAAITNHAHDRLVIGNQLTEKALAIDYVTAEGSTPMNCPQFAL
jgi:hypothetical protein